jgi:hypothetical protein
LSEDRSRAAAGFAESSCEEIPALDADMPIVNVRTLETDLATERWPLIVIGSRFGCSSESFSGGGT